jgi:uncharacterized lipoprotein
MSKSLFVAFVLAMTLAACGKTEEPKPAVSDTAATTAAPAAPAAAGSDEEKERVRKQNAAAEAALSGH